MAAEGAKTRRRASVEKAAISSSLQAAKFSLENLPIAMDVQSRLDDDYPDGEGLPTEMAGATRWSVEELEKQLAAHYVDVERLKREAPGGLAPFCTDLQEGKVLRRRNTDSLVSRFGAARGPSAAPRGLAHSRKAKACLIVGRWLLVACGACARARVRERERSTAQDNSDSPSAARDTTATRRRIVVHSVPCGVQRLSQATDFRQDDVWGCGTMTAVSMGTKTDIPGQ